jgi:hypothetical protein
MIADLEQPLGELPCVVVARSLAEDVLDVRDRLARLVLSFELDPSEPELHVEARVAQRRTESAFEELRELAVAALLVVETIERDERALVIRIDRQDPLVIAGGLRGIFDDFLANERHFREHLRLRNGIFRRAGNTVV